MPGVTAVGGILPVYPIIFSIIIYSVSLSSCLYISSAFLAGFRDFVDLVGFV